jgi:acetyltransferase-like isoleucine patch superfamily enzyme
MKKMKFLKDNPNYKKYNIGEYTYGEPLIYDGRNASKLSIGKFCSIAFDVHIMLSGNHRTDWVTTYPFSDFRAFRAFLGHPSSKGDVVIGNDVWIGRSAKILSGVTIGDGAVIGTEAVVAKSVPPYSIFVGNPARLVKKRFSDSQIENLLEIKWWDWEFEKIKANMPLLLDNNIDAFIRKNLTK